MKLRILYVDHWQKEHTTTVTFPRTTAWNAALEFLIKDGLKVRGKTISPLDIRKIDVLKAKRSLT